MYNFIVISILFIEFWYFLLTIIMKGVETRDREKSNDVYL